MDNSEDVGRMPDDWETIPDEEQTPHPEDKYPIESEFTDGSERVRADSGEYMSVSMAIVESFSTYNDLTAKKIAKKFNISQNVAREHLSHVREVYGPGDSDSAETIQEHSEKEQIKNRADQDLDGDRSY
ncbi:hypothetical protein ACFQL1_16150 [Halomicroarcula sp. GCM10025709]|uniref:hypothetical protein n=1 Tax=Haloarcula TaxID=2237 RepID=UPI0024C2EE10|nr:hypothetical protein [Halomicroarcula sp. YJ-61-S]